VNVKVHSWNIYATFEFQGYEVNLKVMVAKQWHFVLSLYSFIFILYCTATVVIIKSGIKVNQFVVKIISSKIMHISDDCMCMLANITILRRLMHRLSGLVSDTVLCVSWDKNSHSSNIRCLCQ